MFFLAQTGRRYAPFTDLAVDLGTANTLVHVRGQGVVVNEPSVVAVNRSSRAVQAVGLEAKRMIGRTTGEIGAVYPLRGGVIADVDLAETMLRGFLRQAVPWQRRYKRPRVVVAVPSGITELERRAVRSSADAAGAREVYMVAEPIAAAIGGGVDVTIPLGTMIVDVGGGTTDVAVISLGGMVADGSIRVGGQAMDRAIAQHARRCHNLLIGEPTAELVKIGLASATPTGELRTMEVRGRDLVSGIPRAAVIRSDEVARAIQEPILAIVAAVIRTLESTPPELASDIVDHGIILTGGGALIRGLDALIAERAGVPVRIAEDPLITVVRGTAAILDDLDRHMDMLRV